MAVAGHARIAEAAMQMLMTPSNYRMFIFLAEMAGAEWSDGVMIRPTI
jgi:hypothetical protein